MRCNPTIIKSIKNKKGDELHKPEAGCKKVMDQGVADAVNKIFQGPFTSGTLTASRIYGTTLAGKTGTVPSNKAAWTVGYTPDLVTAAVISYDNGPRFKKFWKNHRGYLHGIVLPKSRTYLSGFGSDAGWMLFKPAMTYALKDIDKNTPFNNPPQSVLNGDTVDVPSCSGRGPSSCAALLHAAGFSTYYSKQYHPTIPSGGLIGTSGGGSAGKGSQIAIYVSKGPEPAADRRTHPDTDPDQAEARAQVIGKLAGRLALAGAACVAYGTFIEANAFQVRRVRVPVLPAGAQRIRVLHVSDIHLTTGKRARRRFVAALSGLEPDLVVNTGRQPERGCGAASAARRLRQAPRRAGSVRLRLERLHRGQGDEPAGLPRPFDQPARHGDRPGRAPDRGAPRRAVGRWLEGPHRAPGDPRRPRHADRVPWHRRRPPAPRRLRAGRRSCFRRTSTCPSASRMRRTGGCWTP